MKIEYVVIDESIGFAEEQSFITLLPMYRIEKIKRYRFDKDKLLSLAAGLLIRRAIGESAVRFGEHGKPYTDGAFFSVSHSGRVAAIAVDDAEVGSDIECIVDESRLKLARRFYHPNEREYVSLAADMPQAFTEIWTRKEAYLKYTGEGISSDLTSFDVTSPPLSDRILTYIMDGFCMSVCSEHPIGKKDVYISKLELKDLLNKNP